MQGPYIRLCLSKIDVSNSFMQYEFVNFFFFKTTLKGIFFLSLANKVTDLLPWGGWMRGKGKGKNIYIGDPRVSTVNGSSVCTNIELISIKFGELGHSLPRFKPMNCLLIEKIPTIIEKNSIVNISWYISYLFV